MVLALLPPLALESIVNGLAGGQGVPLSGALGYFALLAAAVAIVKIIGAVYKIPLGNIIGDEGKAHFTVAYNIYNLLLTISTAGLPLAISKLTSEAHALGRENEKRKIFSTSIWLFFGLGLVFSLIMFFGSAQLAAFMNDSLAFWSIRALSPENREFLIRRVQEVAEGIAKTFRASITLEHPTGGTPPSINDPALCDEMLPFIQDIVPADKIIVTANEPSLGSEDFAYVSTKVPAMMISLGAGSTAEGFHYALHSPFVTPDEGCLPVGAALYAHCATEWLRAHQD